jgi:single-strand DNA-binding protein
MSLSKTSIIGRLTRDPEVKQIGNDNIHVANFTVAVDRDFGEGTDFYDVVAWRKLGENVGRFLGKGRLVYVDGRMQKRNYEATVPGTDVKYSRDVWEIQADKVQFLDKGGNDNNETTTAAPSGYAGQGGDGPAPF